MTRSAPAQRWCTLLVALVVLPLMFLWGLPWPRASATRRDPVLGVLRWNISHCGHPAQNLSEAKQEDEPDLVQVEPRFWALLQDNFKPFASSGITLADVDRGVKLNVRPEHALRVLIYENELYLHGDDKAMSTHRAEHFLPFLRVLCRHKVPNMEFAINFFDEPIARRSPDGQPVPVFSWSSSYQHWDILYPFNDAFTDIPPSPDQFVSPYKYDPAVWDRADDRAVWRGVTTGCQVPGEPCEDPFCTCTRETWNISSRAILVGMCNQRPDLCDAQFTDVVQADAEAESLIREHFGIHPAIPWAEQLHRFKYMVLVNGNGVVAASRSDHVLMDPTVPLWQQQGGYEFYYKALKPYVHYIPLSRTLDDIYSAIEWARAHPAVCRRIIREGQEFARRYFNAQFINRYIHALLVEYAKLQTFTPQITAQHRRLVVTNKLFDHMSEINYGGCKYRFSEPGEGGSNS